MTTFAAAKPLARVFVPVARVLASMYVQSVGICWQETVFYRATFHFFVLNYDYYQTLQGVAPSS